MDATRFIGGQIRILSPHIGFEVSLDRHSESFELLNQKVLPNNHLGIHGDYRYTFLDFSHKEDEGFIAGLIPGRRSSMWTLGATFYF